MLNLLANHDHAPASILHVRIRQLHTRTLSRTIVVDILGKEWRPAENGTAFLKFFDRRFADQHRRNNVIEPWTKGMEQAYIDAVESGAVNRFLHDLRHIEGFQESTEDEWDDAQNEAFLAHGLLSQYNTEIASYDELRKYQGDLIPKLYAIVNILCDHSILNSDVNPRHFLVCTAPDSRRLEEFQMFMIDLALCRFRRPDESDAE